MEAWGVMSKLTADKAEDAEETINHVHDDAETALITMGKMVLFRAFGQVHGSTLLGVVSGLEKIVSQKNVHKCVSIGGVTYYVRQLTEEEIQEIRSGEERQNEEA